MQKYMSFSKHASSRTENLLFLNYFLWKNVFWQAAVSKIVDK